MSEARVEQWKRKVLDLSLRNPLLNVRDGAKFLPMKGGCLWSAPSETGVVVPYMPPDVGDDIGIKADIPEKEIKKRLKELYTSSRSMYNESGINSLYVAVGFLSWNEKDGEELHRAPLLLVPAQLVKQTAAPGYKLQRTDEDAAVNFCVVEMLKSQFGIPIQDIEGGGFGDGDPDFDAVFKTFADAIQNRKEWFITTDIALGIFSFSKVVIWKDLTDHIDDFKKHPFVAHLTNGKAAYDDKIPVFPQEEIEKHIKPSKLFCPMSADSSQLAAVLYSELGKSFVLHGPPGTGKSQTITNIIAHNMALGKRVLFVSEKKAALDVVYKRLSACGLAPFCLELHSSKSDKAGIMRQFAVSLEVAPEKAPAHWSGTCAAVESSFREIGAYIADLHKPCANGLSVYDCLAKHIEKHPQAKDSLIAFDVASATHEDVVALGETMRGLAEEWEGVDKDAYKALGIVCDGDWSPAFESKVSAQADALLAALDESSVFKRHCKLIWLSAKGLFNHTVRFPIFQGTFEEQKTRIREVKDHLDGLRLVMSYRATRREAEKAKCPAFIEAMESGNFTCREATRVFEDSCVEKTLNTIISRSRTLSGFSGLKQEERIARFRELDAEYTDSVRKMIVATLSKKVHEVRHPPMVKSADGKMVQPELDEKIKSQLALLKRESEKKKRFMPPRQLLKETSDVATRLKPCFLMSPLSVAQYLPADEAHFDMVVFDEASQMNVWDAVGVIARGKQLIVVGDPKQLPPSSFFMKGDVKDEDREDDVSKEDLESILDECRGDNMFEAHLNWHYRSRHESLIAFSNRHYYGDNLNTFPAAEDKPSLGVSFQYVDGALYDHVSHTNRGEAEAVVETLFKKWADPAERKRSWGVVTFSVAQQRLIENLIDEKSEEYDWAAEFFDDSNPDAFFVKNLENVQGDERDVIVFSIAYAPDAEGRFAMSFGPVNRTGGERRLNVAITRAREQAIIFASTKSSCIRVDQTKNDESKRGVRDLKALMEYAETGHLEGDAARREKVDVSGVKKAVCDFLEANGYEYDIDVGMSSYPIDIAVRDPKNPQRHILGIECDGARYAQQRTVRDRDILRGDVLKNLGWNIFHAWSIDWTFDRKRAEVRLLDVLQKAPKK